MYHRHYDTCKKVTLNYNSDPVGNKFEKKMSIM